MLWPMRPTLECRIRRYGSKANHALIFNLDHSSGAAQAPIDRFVPCRFSALSGEILKYDGRTSLLMMLHVLVKVPRNMLHVKNRRTRLWFSKGIHRFCRQKPNRGEQKGKYPFRCYLSVAGQPAFPATLVNHGREAVFCNP